ncbi:MAG: HAD family hydrolase [Desulfobacca sp.]|nr:HAD family hydrolase [Desulfobacca sp.]
MKHKAILFDLDGTLLDTIEDIADSMNQVLSRFGFTRHDTEAYKTFVGDGVESMVRQVLPMESLDDVLVARCVAAMREEYGRRWDKKTRPYPGIPELLDALLQRGFPMAILSNKPHDFSQLVVAKQLSRWPFQVVLGARPSVPKKPDPAAALEIAGIMHLPPNRFLYLGDTSTDMKTAVAAGMFPLGALWGFRTAQELTTHGARALLEKPQDVLHYL